MSDGQVEKVCARHGCYFIYHSIYGYVCPVCLRNLGLRKP